MSRRLDRHELVAVNAELRVELRRLRRELDRLRVENGVLHEAAQPLIHQAPAHERFAFIHGLRDRFTVKRLCRILVTDRSNYYLWARAEARRQTRAEEERELLELIVETHTASPAYGAERITDELKRQGFTVGRRRVARLMRKHGIAGITRRKRRNLTKPDAGAAAIPDLIQREFTAPMPGLKLIGDISSFPTGEGWLYLISYVESERDRQGRPKAVLSCEDSIRNLNYVDCDEGAFHIIATVLDLCTKELIGYAIAPHMRAALAVDAIIAAHRTGLVAGNAIMHTDRGGQYQAKAYRSALRRLELRPSTSRTGSSLDGAAAESFFATLKAEIGVSFWPDRATARRDIENWILEYNRRRLHSALDYQTPIEVRTA